MRVTFNINREVADYFKDCNLDHLVHNLLDHYDIENLPQMSPSTDRVQREVTVTHPLYITLYKAFGPRSKKVSLGRLLEFAYNMDILTSNPDICKRREPKEDNALENAIKRFRKNLRELVELSNIETITQIIEEELVKWTNCDN